MLYKDILICCSMLKIQKHHTEKSALICTLKNRCIVYVHLLLLFFLFYKLCANNSEAAMT